MVKIFIERQKTFILREDVEQLMNSDPGKNILLLLPHFDPFLLAHADKTQFVDPDFYKRVYRKVGWIFPVVLLNGRAIGVWNYKRSGNRLLIEFEAFENFTKAIKTKIEQETASLEDFIGMPCVLKFGK